MLDKIDISDFKLSSIASYINNAKESLLDSIFSDDENQDEDNLDILQKGKKTTTTALKESNEENGLNGKIDEAVYQGEIGDCWLLSAVLSMSYTENGANVLEESMSINDDGSVDIKFEGIDKEYKVTSEEIAKENKTGITKTDYSKGDDDMLAIELGVEKVVADKTVKTNYSLEDGGNPYYVFKLFDAENIKVADSKAEIKQAFSYYEKNSDECSMTLGVVDESVCGLLANHGYAVKDINDDTVVLVNPWDSTEEIEVDKDELIKNYKNLSIVYAEFES